MDKKTVLQIDDELIQKETKSGTRYFIGKSQPDLRFTDASILVPPVIGINHYVKNLETYQTCLLYTSPSPRDRQKSRMPSSA